MADLPTQRKTPLLNRVFPEKRIFVKSDEGTRFVRLGPRQHLLALVAGSALVIWSVAATSFLVIGIVKGGGQREQAAQEKVLYETRLNALADERDTYRMSALDAQTNYTRALDEISTYQDRIFANSLDLRELETAREALRRILQETMLERDGATERLSALTTGSTDGALVELDRSNAEAQTTMDFLTRALTKTAEDRDNLALDAADATSRMAELQNELEARQRANDKIFTQLENAVTLAMEPLGKMFENVGLPPSQILRQMRDQYSGQGGPLTPISFSTKDVAIDPETLRANAILGQMDELNLYRMAAEKLPFAVPVSSHVRQTSGFGYRRDPITGGKRLHAGLDWAGAYGTTLKATGDGVVKQAGWQSGYGRMVTIQHAFGLETRFAHLSKITVTKGQRVSRGDKIGAMGNSGRSTGTHLHYEVRLNGKPVDPMTYIKAGRNVF